MTARPSPLEAEAHRLWRDWGGGWSRYTICAGCRELVYCGAARRAGPFLCVGCFDVSPEATRMLKRGRS